MFEGKKRAAFILSLGSLLILDSSLLMARSNKTVGDILKKISRTTDKKTTQLKFNSDVDVSNEAKERNLKDIKPPSEKSLGRVSTVEVTRLETVVDKSIKQMYRLIQKYKNSKNRGELWLRQGELYVEKARLVEQRIFNDFDKKSALYQAKKIKRKPKVDLSASRDYYRRSETLYKWFLRDFSKDPRLDQALFFLGYINFELNNEKKGEHYYSLLTSKFPRSNYVNEAHFALGEFYFEKENWGKAYEEYSYIFKDSKSRLYSFAYYKAAWCQYRLGQGDSAVKGLEVVINDARKAKREGVSEKDSRIRLATEALRDIVLFYSVSGDYRSADKYFAKLAGKAYIKMLENLAYLYSSQGALTQSRYIFKGLIARRTFAPEAYQYQKQIVLNYSNAGDKARYKDELMEWVKDYSKNSEWHRANKSDLALLQEAEETREKLLRVHTLKWHQTYQNTKSSSSRGETLVGYSVYFDFFDNSIMAHEMHFYYGELLFELEKYREAALQYQRSVETASDKNDKFIKKASLNRLIAMEKDLPNSEKLEAKSGQSLDPIPMPSQVREFVLAGQDHFKRFPEDEETVEVKFRLARIYYIYNLYDPAEVLFKDIVKASPKSKYAEYSANLLLDIYNIRKDYVGMARVGTEILATKGFENQDLANDIKNIVEKAAFNQAQEYEKTKNYKAAANSFLDFAKANPNSTLSTPSFYNSAVNFERAGLILQAIPIYEKVKKDNKKENADLKKKSMLLQANLYEKTGDLEKAAYLYEDYADEYKKESIRSDLYFNAATIFSGAKKSSKAIENYRKFYDLNKGKKEGHLALFKIAQELDSKNKLADAFSYYKQFVEIASSSIDEYAEASYRVGEIYELQNNRSAALASYKKLSDMRAPKGKRNYYRAASKLKISLDMYDGFVRIRIPSDPGKQQKVLQEKIATLDRLNRSFAEIIKLDSGEHVISSLIWAGKSYEHMGTSIVEAPIPKGLTADEQSQYQAQIQTIAKPMFKSSNDYFESAVEKSFELDIYSKDLNVAYQKMSKVKPTEYRDWDMIQLPIVILNRAGGL